MAITIVSVMVIARLLTPKEIGIFSVGMALITIMQVLRDFGVGRYLIQEKELTSDRIRAAFTIILCTSWGLAAAIFFSAPVIAEFYKEPQTELIIWVLSISFFLAPFGLPVLSLLQREMNFAALYRINVSASFVQAATSIGLAWIGYGALGLAWGAVAGGATMAALATIYRPKEAWVWPGLREWRRVAGFGSFSSGAAIVNQFGLSANDLILGRMLGFSAVGIFSRADSLINMFRRYVGEAAGLVAMPAFSKVSREGGSLREPYLLAAQHATVLAWPFFGVLGLMAFPIVRIMFGGQWDAAVPLVQILSIGGAMLSIYMFGPQALVASGKVKSVFVIELVVQSLRALLIVVAASYSLEAVAGVNSFVFLLSAIIFTVAISRTIRFTFGEFLRAVSVSLAVTICTLLVPTLVYILVAPASGNLVLPLLISIAGAAVGWFAGIFVCRHPIRLEIVVILKNFPIKLPFLSG